MFSGVWPGCVTVVILLSERRILSAVSAAEVVGVIVLLRRALSDVIAKGVSDVAFQT